MLLLGIAARRGLKVFFSHHPVKYDQRVNEGRSYTVEKLRLFGPALFVFIGFRNTFINKRMEVAPYPVPNLR